MRGYKAFEMDLTCRGKQYEVGKTFKERGELGVCNHGMHFCERCCDVFDYYAFDESRTRVCEVEAVGEIKTDGRKNCTNELTIVRELTWDEVLRICNTGYCNTGNKNAGCCNTGNWNTGDRNIGSSNTGDCNAGERNTGNKNYGDKNTGRYNAGDRNTGDKNTGNWNSGDWNASDYNTGCFNTEEQKITLFNKPSDWTYLDWFNSDAAFIMRKCPFGAMWIDMFSMTENEKKAHPEFETTGGYLAIAAAEDRQVWWNNLSDENKQAVMSLPNFDAEIFRICTDIRVVSEP